MQVTITSEIASPHFSAEFVEHRMRVCLSSGKSLVQIQSESQVLVEIFFPNSLFSGKGF